MQRVVGEPRVHRSFQIFPTHSLIGMWFFKLLQPLWVCKGYNLNRQDAKRGVNHHQALHPEKMLKSRIGGKQLRGTYCLLTGSAAKIYQRITGSSSSFFTYELFGTRIRLFEHQPFHPLVVLGSSVLSVLSCLLLSRLKQFCC